MFLCSDDANNFLQNENDHTETVFANSVFGNYVAQIPTSWEYPQSSSILFIRVFHETFQLLGYHVVYRTICAMGLKPGLP